MKTLILIATACLTFQDVLNARCDVACKLGGWAEGKEQGGFCLCSDRIPERHMTKRQMSLPRKPKPHSQEPYE